MTPVERRILRAYDGLAALLREPGLAPHGDGEPEGGGLRRSGSASLRPRAAGRARTTTSPCDRRPSTRVRPTSRSNPTGLAKPVGYAHGVVAAPGRTLYLGGPGGLGRGLALPAPARPRRADGPRAPEPRRRAHRGGRRARARGLDAGLRRAPPTPGVRTRARSARSGARRMGRWYPAMALLEVRRLYEPESLVEIEGIAVIPG